jgi:O-acetyl-ADP-ribose deacetylase (regulator of RNase III)
VKRCYSRKITVKIIYKKGDVTLAPEKVILHGCNAKGVMGSGVARAIRERYPEVYTDYRLTFCRRGLNLGELHRSWGRDGVLILNGITQGSYGLGERHVNYEAVYNVLDAANDLHRTGVKAIAMPRIGAGLGGGNWRIIEAMIEETSTNYQPVVYDYESA